MMGFEEEQKAKLADLAADPRVTEYWTLEGALDVRETTIRYKGETQPIEGVTARLEDGEALESRVTATRLVMLGIFAFAAKKKTGGTKFLTVESPDFFWTIEVERKRISEAMRVVAAINDRSRKAAAEKKAPETPPAPKREQGRLPDQAISPVIVDNGSHKVGRVSDLRLIADLFSHGVISKEEFDILRKRVL